MLAILMEIFQIGSTIAADAPEIVTIVEDAIGAFKGGDLAKLQAAQAAAQTLANSLQPPS